MKDLKFLRSLTKGFQEVTPLLSELKIIKKKLNHFNRKLATVDKKYKFMIDCVGIGINDNDLCDAVKKLLKASGFERVVHYKDKRQKMKREDLQAYSDSDLFIIEVKGVNKETPSWSELSQVLKYKAENKKRNQSKAVYGLSIINHSNQIHASKRSPRFKNDTHINDAINLEFGFISTMDLVRLFVELKTGETNFDYFKRTLQKTGIITYDSKGGKNSK